MSLIDTEPDEGFVEVENIIDAIASAEDEFIRNYNIYSLYESNQELATLE
ncbi:MAG: hypothetical protein IKA36_06945 [Clostridia bacterium]|nr:hypothetical protein [Clostridia bacterium]